MILSTSPRIRVMLSSRCTDTIKLDGRTVELTELRRRLKSEMEADLLFQSQVFDVWINELAPAASGTDDSWEHCLRQIDEADIVLCLYNGNSGWAKEAGEIGICHAELHQALSTAAAKVRLISLPMGNRRAGHDGVRDDGFREYVDKQTRFRRAAKDGNEAIALCKEALRDAIAEMVHLGGREARRGKFHTGDALDWSRLDFEHRRQLMKETLSDALLSRHGSKQHGDHLAVQLDGRAVLAVCHAVPASLTVPGSLDPARQPFLKDHTLAPLLTEDVVGPVHIIVCHQSATETQAIRQLGFADAVVVSPPFGIYLADNIQKVQLIFIKGCRDSTSTRHGVQRCFEWLTQTGEDRMLADRAESRARITQAIARELC